MTFVLLRRFAEALVAGLIAGAVLLVLAPVFLGWRPHTVATGSMRPAIEPGDVVMVRPMTITDAREGDVVTFSDPNRDGARVTARIRSISYGARRTRMETRGDADDASGRWTIRSGDAVGRVVYVLPGMGHVATAIRTPIGTILLVVLSIVGVVGGLLRRIRQEDVEAGEEAGPGPPVPSPEVPGPAVGPADPAAARARARDATAVGADR